MNTRLWVASLSALLFECCHATDVVAQDFDVRVAQWLAWSEQIRDWSVDTTSVLSSAAPGDADHRLLKHVDASHFCLLLDYTKSHVKHRAVVIRNPSYFAKLESGLDDHWVLSLLTRSHEAKFAKTAEEEGSVNSFLKKVADPGLLLESIQKERDTFQIRQTRDGQTERFSITSNTSGTPAEGTLFAKLGSIELSFDSYAAPTRVDYSYMQEAQTVTVSRVFDEWQQVKGVSVPTRVRTYKPNGFSDAAVPLEIATFDYSTIDVSKSREECYLTYYGLPEPGGSSSSGFRTLGFVGFGLVALALLVFWLRGPR